MDRDVTTLKDQIASLESGDLRRAFLEAVKDYTFANDSCREASFKLVSSAVKRQADGTYVAENENLPLAYFITSRPWFEGMLKPAPEILKSDRTILGVDGSPVRGAVGGVNIDLIKPGMSAELKAQARAAIAAELAKLQG